MGLTAALQHIMFCLRVGHRCDVCKDRVIGTLSVMMLLRYVALLSLCRACASTPSLGLLRVQGLGESRMASDSLGSSRTASDGLGQPRRQSGHRLGKSQVGPPLDHPRWSSWAELQLCSMSCSALG